MKIITHTSSGSKLEYEKIGKERPMHDKPLSEGTTEAQRQHDERMPLPKALQNDIIHDGYNTEPMMQFFEYKHLPQHLQDVSKQFYFLAGSIIETLPRNPERTAALRKLLEAKDCAVRAKLYK